MSGCIFCQVAAGEIPATIVKRGDGLIAFRDINPQAPTHLLVIPTQHVPSLNDAKDPQLLGRMLGFGTSRARRGWPSAATGSCSTRTPTAARRCSTCTSTCWAGARCSGRRGEHLRGVGRAR